MKIDVTPAIPHDGSRRTVVVGRVRTGYDLVFERKFTRTVVDVATEDSAIRIQHAYVPVPPDSPPTISECLEQIIELDPYGSETS